MDNGEKAIDTLSQVAQLATQMAEQNRLKEDELKIQHQEAENKARELDLQAQAIALERERLNRAEANNKNFILMITEIQSKLVTTDDAFGETVQRTINAMKAVVSAQIDIEKSNYAMLSQNSPDIREARLGHPKRMKTLQIQELILEHTSTLHNLKMQEASYGSVDTPVHIKRKIEREQADIEKLEDELKSLEGG